MVTYLNRYNYIGYKHKNTFRPKQVNKSQGINLADILIP